MQVRFFILCVILSFASFSHAINQPQPGIFLDATASLHSPVKFTNNGIQNFLRHTFSHPLYSQEVLAHDFSHLIQFLQHGKRMGQKRTYCKSVLRLFTNKLKSTPFVNAYAFHNMLKDLPEMLNSYFIIFKLADINPAKLVVHEVSMNHFANQFSLFKDNPNLFFNDLSQHIIDALNSNYQISEEISIEELRKTILILLEIGLSKLVWTPEDTIETWELCKKISDQLSVLMETNIICDPDDLNDLFITLVERYCYFLEITGADLPVEFFEKIKQIIASESLLFLDMEEQEQSIETKAERLIRTLKESEAKARARQAGIIVK